MTHAPPDPDLDPKHDSLGPLLPSERGPTFAGGLWMLVIGCALFFVPVVNGLVAGLVGGYLVRGTERALLVAVFVGIVYAAVLWTVMMLVRLPLWGSFSVEEPALVILGCELGLFAGAAIGGYAGFHRARRR